MENFPNYAGYGQSPTVCVNHPDRVSYTRCGRCNRTICGECQTAQDAGVVCPDCYRELNGGASRPKRSFIARHWHITYTLILINVVVYGLQLIIPFRWMYNLGMMSGPRVHHGEYYRLITHGFVHSQTDPMHLVWNMIYLFIFGVSLERMMGRWKFLFVYMAATVGAVCTSSPTTVVSWAPQAVCTASTARSSSFCFFGSRRILHASLFCSWVLTLCRASSTRIFLTRDTLAALSVARSRPY